MDKEKLARLQAQVRIGGKGTPRRKQVKKSTSTIQGDDRKLQTALKKLGVQPVTGVEEVNMFKEDGNVLHFNKPAVHSAQGSNTMAVYGNGQNKDLTELVPGILNQIGPDSLATLRKLAESYQSMSARAGAGGAAKEDGEKEADDDDEIPQLVENFDDVEGDADKADKGESKLEELN